MTEGIPQHFETVPTAENISAVFETVVGSKEYAETRRLEDERGVYLWEIRVETEDGYTGYEYNRAGPNPKGKGLQTAVYATFYDKDGMPISGGTVARLVDNKWDTNLPDLDSHTDYSSKLP